MKQNLSEALAGRTEANENSGLFGPNSGLATEFYAEPAADAKGWFK